MYYPVRKFVKTMGLSFSKLLGKRNKLITVFCSKKTLDLADSVRYSVLDPLAFVKSMIALKKNFNDDKVPCWLSGPPTFEDQVRQGLLEGAVNFDIMYDVPAYKVKSRRSKEIAAARKKGAKISKEEQRIDQLTRWTKELAKGKVSKLILECYNF